MALLDNGKRFKDTNVIEIKENGGDGSYEKLHPHYEKSFTTFFGRVKSIRNLMLFLNREHFPAHKLNKSLNPKELNYYLRDKIKHVPNYWYVLELAAVDKVMFEKDVVKEILKTDNLREKTVIILNLVKKGILTQYERNNKYNRYGKTLKVIFLNIKDVAGELDIIDEILDGTISKEKYKEFKNKVKERILEDVLSRIKEPLLEGITETNLEEFKSVYMS